MAVKNGAAIGGIGGPTRMPIASGVHNFARIYEKSAATGDVRGEYRDLYFDSTGGGEAVRVRGIANGAGCAAGSTINAIHATGRVAAAKTISGSLNAIRATLEVAGTTPTPGGTLAALQLDSNIVTGWVDSGLDSFIRVTQSGVGALSALLNMPAPVAHDTTSLFVSTADKAATHQVRFVSAAGVVYWLLATTNAPS